MGYRYRQMRKLLIGTIAVIVSSLPLAAQETLETPASTEVFESKPATGSIWLLLSIDDGSNYSTLEKIEMRDMDQCQIQGASFMAAETIGRHQREKGFMCLEGK